MIHGVELPELDTYNEVLHNELKKLFRDFAQHSGDMFFQLGCINVIDRTKTKQIKSDGWSAEIVKKKTYQHSEFLERYDMSPSRREHMPNATIQLDLTKTLPELKSDFSSSWKRYLNKAKKQALVFAEATEKEWEKFRDVRYAMAFDKGFYVVPKEEFLQLMKYLSETKQWTLLLAKKWSAIVSGNVVLFVDDMLLYLYGATDRSFGHIGGHYWLMYETMRRWRDHHFKIFDLFGIAPPGEETGHHLEWVTRFKQSFGGTTISYVGNYDVVFNRFLYKTFKLLKR